MPEDVGRRRHLVRVRVGVGVRVRVGVGVRVSPPVARPVVAAAVRRRSPASPG